jgi:flavin-dependent dehydrogenase
MDADVVVIGGGPVGASLGMLLPRAGLRAVVLDRAQFPRDKPCGEGLMPSGAAVLRDLGVDLAAEGFPPVRGVRYRLHGGGTAFAAFAGPGFGVRRLRLDALLAERAGVCCGVAATGLRARPDGVEVETASGTLRARALVGADGLRSQVRAWMGWERPPRSPRRHALVGHWEFPGHELDEITVTLLGDVEVYVAPCSSSELLAAVLGPRGSLRLPESTVMDSYRQIVTRAHPELRDSGLSGRVWGAGPFRTAPANVATGRVFLAGDAAGFCDPLTGEAMAAGLAQARALAGFLAEDVDSAAARYRRWHRTQWRRRRVVGGLALALTGSDGLARRAMAGLARRPAALERLLEVNDGSRGLATIRPRDWTALAGL